MEYFQDEVINKADTDHLVSVVQFLFKCISEEDIKTIFYQSEDHWHALRLLKNRYPDKVDMDKTISKIKIILYGDYTSTIESCAQIGIERHASHENEIREMAKNSRYVHQLTKQITDADFPMDPRPGSLTDIIDKESQNFNRIMSELDLS